MGHHAKGNEILFVIHQMTKFFARIQASGYDDEDINNIEGIMLQSTLDSIYEPGTYEYFNLINIVSFNSLIYIHMS